MRHIVTRMIQKAPLIYFKKPYFHPFRNTFIFTVDQLTDAKNLALKIISIILAQRKVTRGRTDRNEGYI